MDRRGKESPEGKFYVLDPHPTAHVNRTEVSDAGLPTSAEFFFDYNSEHVIMGRYGYFAVTAELAAEMAPMRFTGYSLGTAKASIWRYAEEGVDIKLPEIDLLIITGSFMEDDFSRGSRDTIVVSDRVLQFLAERDPEVAVYAREVGVDGRPILHWPKI